MLRRGIVIAALAGVLVVPAAAAGSAPQVTLAVVPLPKPALGAPGRPLALARDSGAVSNADAASEASGNVTTAQLQRLGRVTGYLLDYGNPFGTSAGVREIQTGIERYTSATTARKGLDFWRRDEQKNSTLKQFGIDFSLEKLQLSGVPAPHWAYAGTVSIKGLQSVYGVDAEFQQGQYLLDVSISAGSSAAAARLAPTVARAFYLRTGLALAGRLRATPVKLPRRLKAGPPAHGPKPAGMVLTKADVGGTATIARAGYSNPKAALDPNALSAYDLTLTSPGTFPYLSQEVLVGSGTLEVQYFAAITLGGIALGLGNKVQTTPLDLSSVGDSARGELLQLTVNGRQAYEGVVVLSHGSYLDFLVTASTSALTAADVQNLAELAAKRLDAGF